MDHNNLEISRDQHMTEKGFKIATEYKQIVEERIVTI